MRNIFTSNHFFTILFAFIIVSCSTSSSSRIVKPESLTENFIIKKIVVTDSTGTPPDLNIDIKNRMKESFRDKLTKYNSDNQYFSKYSIYIDIRDYEQGSAALRWAIPGMGETYLNVEATLYDENKNVVSQYRAARSVQGGGGYTAGAWKRVFDSVSSELLKNIFTKN